MAERRAPGWKIVLAFFVIGFVIATFTGDIDGGSFSLEGLPALIAFALVIAYMIIPARRGGRLWQRILGTVGA